MHSVKPTEMISDILYCITLSSKQKAKITIQLTFFCCVIEQLILKCFWQVRKTTTKAPQINHLTN